MGIASYRAVSPDTPSLRTPIGDLGAAARARVGLGEAEIGLASSIEVAAQHEQDRQDVLAAEDAYTQLKNKQLDLTYGDGGFATLKGAAAVKQPLLRDYTQQFDSAADDISKTLGNRQQQSLFAQRAAVSGVQFKEGILRHVIAEGDTYADDVYNGIVGTAIRSATASWNSPVEVQGELQRVDEALKSRAERSHWPAEYTETQRLKAFGAIHNAVIGQADASGNYVYASDWYEAHKGEIDRATAERLQLIVRDGREKQTVANYSTMLRQAGNGLPALYELEKRVESEAIIKPQDREILLAKIERAIKPVEAKGIADRVLSPPVVDDLTRVAASGVGAATTVANDDSHLLTPAHRQQLQEGLQRDGLDRADFRMRDPSYPGGEVRGTILRTGASGPDGSPLVAKDTKAMLGEWISRAAEEAERLHPGDPVFRDLAVSQVRTRVSTIVAAQEGMQRQAHGFLLMSAAGITADGKVGQPVTNLSDLLGNPQARAAWNQLDADSMRGVVAYVEQQALKAEGRPTQISTRLEQQLFSRMVLPGDDPQAITRPEQLTQFVAQGLSTEGHSRLVAKMDQLKTPEGRGFQVRVDKVVRGASHLMSSGIVGKMLADAQPEKLAQAQLDFQLDLDQKIEEKRAKGEDPGVLLTPGNPQYVGTYEHVSSFLPSARRTVADQAGRARTEALDVSDVQATQQDESTWGKRLDGTAKGRGFLGVLKRPDGGVSSEITIGVQINGKETEVPSLVPTLTRAEVNTLLSLPDGTPVPQAIVAKAKTFAESRIKAGKSVFATEAESPRYKPVRLSSDSKKADEEFAALPKGALYVGPDNVQRTK